MSRAAFWLDWQYVCWTGAAAAAIVGTLPHSPRREAGGPKLQDRPDRKSAAPPGASAPSAGARLAGAGASAGRARGRHTLRWSRLCARRTSADNFWANSRGSKRAKAAPGGRVGTRGRSAQIADCGRPSRPTGVAPSYASRVRRLTLLAPGIVEAVLDGRQPEGLRLEDLLDGFPLEWVGQSLLVGSDTAGASSVDGGRRGRLHRSILSPACDGSGPAIAAHGGRVDRAWSALIQPDGRIVETPPSIDTESTDRERLAAGVRAFLEALPPDSPSVAYAQLADALDVSPPHRVGQVARALEITMGEDAAAGRPFLAALVVGRARGGLPARGFYDRAAALGRGPEPGETEAAFHDRELAATRAWLAGRPSNAPPRGAWRRWFRQRVGRRSAR